MPCNHYSRNVRGRETTTSEEPRVLKTKPKEKLSVFQSHILRKMWIQDVWRISALYKEVADCRWQVLPRHLPKRQSDRHIETMRLVSSILRKSTGASLGVFERNP